MKLKDKEKDTRIKNEAFPASAAEPQSEEHERIIEFFKKLRFRKKMFGGVDERVVWKKLEELDRLYEEAIRAEKLRGKALINEYKRSAIAEIEKLEKMIRLLREKISGDSSDSKPATGSSDEEE